ncbi:cytochrome bd menaquinol oxidase, subunit I [Citrifermentans bemidjiense Bem]|uniref:Cytochrome bd menaquinol oxidase, subunit I n=1 Tax=Citrifermentans bemidjiense (strain ATCC BAA-1014 / DSM 16622 / JCM 12645 / Bem) TaxID=404380 RepID=B5EI24_CITBB|nr:cytochrome ubiquinol oxidase subunit I [Citrifermentans bemidjiense]ACH38288.1 cytochrome bd menaquinol oxidase, subunit I [Citrifermentans bemidjiense Bem]
MDVLTLSRLQFAVTSMFHFIFVPLTLGLSVLVAAMETRYVVTGNEMYKRMTKFWGKLFLINFALGVVTGITLEFQFGMNWAEYSRYVGDIFGAPLAIEATVAFFLESVFIGVWAFGWNKVGKKMHAASIWIVALATNLSGLWILLANGWMQHPVGYVLRNGRAEMVDFMALITNPFGLLKFGHQIVSGYTVGAFFVMGVSAWHLLRGRNRDFFKASFGMAAVFALASTLMVAVIGDFHAVDVAKTQPAKFAAMESIWDSCRNAPMHLIAFPDEKNQCNLVSAFPVPGMLSLLAYHDLNAEVRGLNSFPKADRPPVLPVFLSFRAMVGLGTLFIVLAAVSIFFHRKNLLEKYPWFLRAMVLCIPLPYIANQLGWVVSEVGRQPWIVYGLMRTSDAVSKSIDLSQVIGSLLGFTLLYGLLGFVDIYLLAKFARKGPEETTIGATGAFGK